MTSNKIDLTGLDKETGRYCRKGESDENRSVKKQKLEEESKSTIKVKPNQIKNISNWLKMRETGSLSGVVAESEYMKMMVHKKKEIWHQELNVTLRRRPLPSLPRKVIKVQVIKGSNSQKSVYGEWLVECGSDTKPVLMENRFYHIYDHRQVSAQDTYDEMIDLCDAPNNFVIGLYRNSVKQYLNLYHKRTNDVLVVDMHDATCVSTIGNAHGFAVGGKNYLHFYYSEFFTDAVDVKGTVKTIATNRCGELLAAGLDHGQIQIYEIGSKIKICELNGLSTCILESTFREGTPYVLFAGHTNKLFEVDLRTNRVVTQYLRHCEEQGENRKRNYLNVTKDCLCLTGSDNIIRIWHLSGGNPIFEMGPIMNHQNSIKGWVNTLWDRTYLNYFEAGFKKVFRIM